MRVKVSVKKLSILLCLLCVGIQTRAETLQVGIAEQDITPDYPVRLNGFGSRRTESEGVTQKIRAEALAFADKRQGPAIIITVDNLAVPDEITSEIAALLAKAVGVKRERLAISATHTHTAPMLKNVSPTLYGNPIPPEHQAHIDQYTREFVKKLEAVAVAAVKNIRPSVVTWGCGKVGFAINRRTKGGPVDHDLPMMMISNPDGTVRGVYFSYACHCVTLSNNKISGDWAGFAKEAVQKAFPGAIALASIGCGADSNPTSGATGGRVAAVEDQGKQIADEIKRLVAAGLKPIKSSPETRYTRVEIPFDTPRTRAEWEERAKSSDYAIAYHAKVNLERLDRREELPRSMTYPIATWVFGEDLVMVFLPGETVVDYALRIKTEFDRQRLWINGYANESRCYLPSERILQEGGYEGGGAMIYYDRPQRFAPGVEAKIMAAVTQQVPKSWAVVPGSEGLPPKSPKEALQTIRTHAGLKVELVAAEPLVQSPVAIDWGADRKLWVCEMFDYPAGPRGDYEPGGRVRFLEDTNHDGRYDKATVFLKDLPFPTGVMAWGKGVFVCAAPDIIYAEDTNGDGMADKVQKLYTGFATENYQARVNSLSLGLDNWIYGANGLISRSITTPSGTVDIRNHDFRFRPVNGAFEPVSGPTQQGLVRDDWGRWFGCANSDLMWYYAHEERYLRRNPNVPVPAAMVWPPADHDVNRIYPTSRLLERFNDPDAANRVTSGCGISVYRDTLLGEAYRDNTFTCEPVHNLVTRLVLREKNGRMIRARADAEKASEFLSSTDNWFRPVQTRTGPDGALYIVDMYRFVVEHPRWIPAARLARLNVRAGADMGRIYRVYPEDRSLHTVPDLATLNGSALARKLDSPNGTERDRVHAEILTRNDRAAAKTLEELAASAPKPEVRVQALCVLDGLGALKAELVRTALKDSHPKVRKHAVRLCETFLKSDDRSRSLLDELLKCEKDSASEVLHQLAYTLGEWNDPRAGQALGRLAIAHSNDAEMKTAVLSSATRHCGAIMDAIVAPGREKSSNTDWVPLLAATAAASGNDELLAKALVIATPPDTNKITAAELTTLAKVMEALQRKNVSYSKFVAQPSLQGIDKRIQNTFAAARNGIVGKDVSSDFREAAVRLMGSMALSPSDLEMVAGLLLKPGSPKLQTTIFDVLRQQKDNGPATYLIKHWPQLLPAARPPAIALLLSRDESSRALLQAVEQGTIRSTEISLGEKQSLLQKSDPQIRELAAKVFPARTENRTQVLEKYQPAISLAGSSPKGIEVFKTSCATCHLLDGIGHDVGPDLAPLRNKGADYFIKNILDPNSAVEPRFVGYEVTLKDGRSLSGIIKSETATAITLVGGSGVTEVLKPAEVETIQASSLSLMPEGLEQAITPQDMADLIAFLRNTSSTNTGKLASPGTLVREPAAMARIILDGSQPNDVREALIGANPQFASEFLTEMTRDLAPGTPEEYVRIPWIWRVAIAAGKRNDSGEIKRVLAVSVPALNAPLRDWEAVVIGGGIINGLSLKGVWPTERIAEIIGSDSELAKRWARSLKLAAAMADDTKVPGGTRYDALRMLGVLPWNQSGEHLVKYLAKDTDGELQQGAVSGLSDVRSPKVGPALVSGLSYFSKSNRDFALDALVRDESRIAVLLDEIAAGRVTKKELKPHQVERLNSVKDPALARRVREMALKQPDQTSR